MAKSNYAAQDMQRCMGTHHVITEVPINGTDDLRSYLRRKAIKRMPDNIVALIQCNYIAFVLTIMPRHRATIGHLASSAWEKHCSVKRHLVTFDCDNFRSAFKHITVLMVEQLCLHRAGMLLDIYLLFNKKPLVHRRDERNSRGTTLISRIV
jgi:hypothetical protein